MSRRRDWSTREYLATIRTILRSGGKKDLAPLAGTVLPTEPGDYLDQDGDPWRLDDRGNWFDEYGQTRPPEYNRLLVICAPFTRVEDDVQVQ